jgi:RTX toxin acyltransferase family
VHPGNEHGPWLGNQLRAFFKDARNRTFHRSTPDRNRAVPKFSIAGEEAAGAAPERRLPAWLVFGKGSRDRPAIQKTGIQKIHTEFVHERRACIFSTCTEPAKSFMGRNSIRGCLRQEILQSSFANQECRCFCESVGRGGETGGLGISTHGQFRIFHNSERRTGVALRRLADDLVAKRIDANDRRLAAVEWKSGINMRIIDIIAPFGGEAEMQGQLKGS